MVFNINIPTGETPIEVALNPGNSAIFVGANGGGKTRLAVFIEESFGADAHRISAHRSLTLDPKVPKISEDQALSGLKFGAGYTTPNIQTREPGRWAGKAATHLLNDYDYLMQALFADQANTSLIAYNASNHLRAENPAEIAGKMAGETDIILATTLHDDNSWSAGELYRISRVTIGVDAFHGRNEWTVRQELHAHFNHALKVVAANLRELLPSHAGMVARTVKRMAGEMLRIRSRLRPGRSFPRASRQPGSKWIRVARYPT